jgi:prepilin-type N-terminal cleavage/methylation domain-containing protein
MKPFTFRKTHQTAGFTLIEVLVVVIIAAILAAITAPGWLAFLNRQRVSTVKSDLAQTLKNAQQDAIQRRIDVPVVINDGAATPSIVVSGLDQPLGDDDNNPGGVQLRSYSVGADGDPNYAFDTIVFDYRGMPTIGNSASDDESSSDHLPFVVSVRVGDSGDRQCVVVANLLGSLKSASNADCDDPNVATD